MALPFRRPIPEGALPPDQVRILSVETEPYPSGDKVRVLIEMTPFENAPNLEFVITDARGQEVGRASVIEAVTESLTITMHLRSPDFENPLNLSAQLGYSDLGVTDSKQVTFSAPQAPE